jgi:hypothetical protein
VEEFTLGVSKQARDKLAKLLEYSSSVGNPHQQK